jgi:Ca-activated chloride channel homolog
MIIITRRNSSVLLLSSLLFLHGCTGSPVSDSQKENQADATAPVAADSERHGDNKPIQTVTSVQSILPMEKKETTQRAKVAGLSMIAAAAVPRYQDMTDHGPVPFYPPQFQRESYDAITENPFIATVNDPLSTFSTDVDTASYANVRRWLHGGTLPPVGSVRIEEMINYFSYQYPEPDNGPIGISAELGPCPWQSGNKLVRIGVKAKAPDAQNLPPSNLVFLIDVSGSMNRDNKLPLLQQSMLMLAGELTEQDRVAIVAYAGADRIVLPPTAGDKKEEIRKAITSLSSGGATHASSGILTAYQLARQNFIIHGNNRIILASDGDFNVGVTSRDELERLVAKERDSGVFLTVLGFGISNYHDDTMEILADKGNGNYSYIDSLLEAKKVLIKERAGTLFTLARDVKLQIEFNPAHVGAYRLIGYENRALTDEDFNNDTRDAGEIGSGHTVTALYELVPAGSPDIPRVDPLKYQHVTLSTDSSGEVLSIKLRYKPLNCNTSRMLTKTVTDNSNTLESTSDDFRFAATVAGFGMLLRHSEHAGSLTYSRLITMARESRGADIEGYRAELAQLLEMGQLLQAN